MKMKFVFSLDMSNYIFPKGTQIFIEFKIVFHQVLCVIFLLVK